jgi:hypothetical protein
MAPESKNGAAVNALPAEKNLDLLSGEPLVRKSEIYLRNDARYEWTLG